jgi:hypothetical protein
MKNFISGNFMKDKYTKNQTMTIIPILSFVLLLSCSESRTKNDKETSITPPLDHPTIESRQETKAIRLLGNGLMSNLEGDWLNTIFTDSIIQTKEIYKWHGYLMGALMISIKENDTLIRRGERYIDYFKYEVINDRTLVLPDNDNFEVVYSPEKDLVYFGNSSIYKKPTFKNVVQFTSNEELLMDYLKNLLFKQEYLPDNFASKIKYVGLYLETYHRFTFDAIGIENQNGEIQYYGWKFFGDTLNLYKTSSIYDGDSEFTFYEIGALEIQYYNKN